MEDINLEKPLIPYNRFRPLPIAIEIIPFLIYGIGYLLDSPTTLTIGLVGFFAVYVCLGWYIFKSNKYTTWNTIFAIVLGGFIFVVLTGLTFYLHQLDGWKMMVVISYQGLMTGTLISLIYLIVRYANPNIREYEFTMSQKIFLRFIILTIIYYSLGLHTYTSEILAS